MQEESFDELVAAIVGAYDRVTVQNLPEPDEHACALEIPNHCKIVVAYEVQEQEIQILNIVSMMKGAGKRVIEFIIDFANENDITLVVKKVLDTAITFWEDLGFTRIGLSEDYILQQ